jgi:hypothetical protein
MQQSDEIFHFNATYCCLSLRVAAALRPAALRFLVWAAFRPAALRLRVMAAFFAAALRSVGMRILRKKAGNFSRSAPEWSRGPLNWLTVCEIS